MLVTWFQDFGSHSDIHQWLGQDLYVIYVNVLLVTLFKTRIIYINKYYSSSLTSWLPKSESHVTSINQGSLPLARSIEKRD